MVSDRQSDERDLLANKYSSIVSRVKRCPLCAHDIQVKLSKLGRPFFSCRHCISRMFLNSIPAARQLRLSDQGLRFTDGYVADLMKNYKALEEDLQAVVKSGPKHREFADDLIKRAEALSRRLNENESQRLRKRLSQAGRNCILCGCIAEWRRLKKKGDYQACRFCATALFIHSTLGLAGVLSRHRFLRHLLRVSF